jgi:3'(2'), 5'-bisphosphate nucleotidase
MQWSDFDDVVTGLRAVGRDILAWRDDAQAKTLHSRKDFKTEADRRAHAALVAILKAAFPADPVISEEDATHDSARPSRYWIIDPIDGTASWYEGYSGFVTQVALIEDARPVFGAVYAPALDRLWLALAGAGARTAAGAMEPLRPRDGLVIVDNTPQPHGIAAELMREMAATGYRESGSLGLKVCLVADGTADLFVKDVVVRDWDMAPAAVILAELGGWMSMPDGSAFRFDGSLEKSAGVIAARTPELGGRAVAVIRRLRPGARASNPSPDQPEPT